MVVDDGAQEYRITPVERCGERWDGVYIDDQQHAYLGRVCELYTGVALVSCVEPLIDPNGAFCQAPENWRALVIERLGYRAA